MTSTASTPLPQLVKLYRPGPGRTVTVPIDQDHMTINFHFEVYDSVVAKEGQDLILFFEDGGRILFQGYYNHFIDETLPAMLMECGELFWGEAFLTLFNDEELFADLEPGVEAAEKAPSTELAKRFDYGILGGQYLCPPPAAAPRKAGALFRHDDLPLTSRTLAGLSTGAPWRRGPVHWCAPLLGRNQKPAVQRFHPSRVGARILRTSLY
jgi:hypothetical protein